MKVKSQVSLKAKRIENTCIKFKRRRDPSRARSSKLITTCLPVEMLCVSFNCDTIFRKASNICCITLQLTVGYALFSRVDFVIQRTHTHKYNKKSTSNLNEDIVTHSMLL